MTTAPLVRRESASAFKLVSTLGLTALLSGIAIASVYEVTRATIAEHRARTLRESVFDVLPGAARMEPLPFAAASGDSAIAGDDVAYAAYDAEDRLVGYALRGEGPGYQDTIELLAGYDPAGARLTGMRVLDSRETPGLGDKIYKDAGFVGAFRDLDVEGGIQLTKGGAEASNEVDAITGATISSRAVVGILNRSLARWRPLLDAREATP